MITLAMMVAFVKGRDMLEAAPKLLDRILRGLNAVRKQLKPETADLVFDMHPPGCHAGFHYSISLNSGQFGGYRLFRCPCVYEGQNIYHPWVRFDAPEGEEELLLLFSFFPYAFEQISEHCGTGFDKILAERRRAVLDLGEYF